MSFTLDVPFPPIYLGLPAISARDPHGLLPLLRRIRAESKKIILHWDVRAEQLAIWYWPVKEGQRVPPSELNDMRETHHFRAPCCLCATASHEYTEAAIFMVTTGRLAGEYVAACARGRCKYWAFLERLYNKRGLPIKIYSRRDDGPVPGPVYYSPEHTDDEEQDENIPPPTPSSRSNAANSSAATAGGSESDNLAEELEVRGVLQASNRPAKRARVSVTLDFTRRLSKSSPLPRRKAPTTFGKLMQLDSTRRGGLTVEEFNGLFVQCSHCRLITTKPVFRAHTCEPVSQIPAHVEVIDLTIGED